MKLLLSSKGHQTRGRRGKQEDLSQLALASNRGDGVWKVP